MAEEDKTSTPSKQLGASNSPNPNPESPTTARPLDFDDEPQESGITSSPSAGETAEAPPAPQENAEAPPAMPPRPVSPHQQAENTLKEAFPSIEAGVVKAVLVASGWDVERAFHALLGMTDPNAVQEAPPAKPPRPSQPPTSTGRTQLEADEMYARQLAEHYNRRAPPRWENERYQRPRGESDMSEDRDYSFFDDDLPVIRDNIRKGFLETQSKVNSWVTDLKKRIDGEEVDDPEAKQAYGEAQHYARTRQSGELGRRSYDADPQVLSDDFTALELRDSEAPPPRPPRPVGNSSLKKTSSPSPDRRKVSFQDGPPTDIDNTQRPEAKRAPSSGNKSSKWQPLSTVEPSPVGEHDPFSLGDSDDEKEKEAKAKDQSTSVEGDRIKEATAEAMARDMGSESKDNNKTEGTGK